VNIIFTDDKNNPGIINLDLKGLTQDSKYCWSYGTKRQ
jgi:hypothetical protein